MKSFVVSTNKTVFQWGDWLLKYVSFGGHQCQTIEHMNALYETFQKKNETLQKKNFEFLSIPSKFLNNL